MSERKQPGEGTPSGLAPPGRLAWRPGVKIRPSGKILRVSILAVALAGCVAVGVYVHSLSPEVNINKNSRVSSFPQDFDRRPEEELPLIFTLGAPTKSTESTVRGGNSDGLARDGSPGGFGGLERLDGLGRNLRGLGELMGGIADMKLEGLGELRLDLDLDEFDKIVEFAEAYDEVFRLSGSEDPAEGTSVDSQRTHSPGSSETAQGRPLAETAGRVGITPDDAE